MGEVDRFAYLAFDFLDLLLVEYMVEIRQFCGLVVASELNCWESKFTLFHVVVDLLVEVLAHVCFKDHRKVIAEPFSGAPGLA